MSDVASSGVTRTCSSHCDEAVLQCSRSSAVETEQNEWNRSFWSRIIGAVPDKITVNWATWGRPLAKPFFWQLYSISRISAQAYWRVSYESGIALVMAALTQRRENNCKNYHRIWCCKHKLNFALDGIVQSVYADWLRAGRLKGRSLSLSRVKSFLFSTSSRPALEPIQHPIQWVPGAFFPRGKAAGASSWSLTSN
jgi:hypothetical protein